MPLYAWIDPEELQEFEDPRISKQSGHMKVVRLSALSNGRLYPPRNIPGTHFCQRLSRPQSHTVAGKVKSMKNPNDLIGNLQNIL